MSNKCLSERLASKPRARIAHDRWKSLCFCEHHLVVASCCCKSTWVSVRIEKDSIIQDHRFNRSKCQTYCLLIYEPKQWKCAIEITKSIPFADQLPPLQHGFSNVLTNAVEDVCGGVSWQFVGPPYHRWMAMHNILHNTCCIHSIVEIHENSLVHHTVVVCYVDFRILCILI